MLCWASPDHYFILGLGRGAAGSFKYVLRLNLHHFKFSQDGRFSGLPHGPIPRVCSHIISDKFILYGPKILSTQEKTTPSVLSKSNDNQDTF